ncbi:hypothetical protein GCM10009077_22470 [Roseibium denhamense]|uniref:Cbb3-type cytochrome c oxidase subunit 3 n=1 Tax=Roseibium denhamense TaxID=76305 RepID=A0ABY1P1M8_9HYPH|nr:hypothetical protein SAMN06265374_2335 [Roseibium denhamense]
MIETFNKLIAIPLQVWIGLTVFVVGLIVFMRATNPARAKGDFRVSKPERPLKNGSPYRGLGPSEDAEQNLISGNDRLFRK